MWFREVNSDNIPINLTTIHVKTSLVSIRMLPKLNISITTREINSPIHYELHINNFTKIAKDFLQMAFINVP